MKYVVSDDIIYSAEYANYIMEHSPGDRVICNGDMLVIAMEEGYLLEDFLEWKEKHG